MKKTIFISIAIMLFATSCSTSKSVFADITDQQNKKQYITEIDDPTTRGMISRISPELTNVYGTVDMSSDGRYLYYSGQVYAGSWNWELWRLDLEGESLPVRLTSGEANDKTLDSWNPTLTNDDEHIMFKSGKKIWMMKSDGTGGRISFPGSGYSEDYSPDISIDNNVVFGTMKDDKYVIWVSNLDGTNLRYLREGATPSWSPDGSSIVFTYEHDIWTVNLNGTGLTQMTHTPLVAEKAPVYSYDGSKFYFSSNRDKDGAFGGVNAAEEGFEKILSRLTDQSYNIWSLDLNGTNLTQISELDAWDSYPYSSADGLFFLSGRGNGKEFLGEDKVRVWKLANNFGDF